MMVLTRIVMFLALSLAGCAGEHFTSYYGKSYRKTFAVQVLYPEPKQERVELSGLDSNEASAVSGAYLKSLAPGQPADDAGDQIIYVEPARPGSRAPRGK